MTQPHLMKRFLYTLIISLNAASAFAQTDDPVDSVPAARPTFTLALVYANDANYYGQKAEQSNPYFAIAGVFKTSSGFYLTGQAYRLLKDTAGIASAGSLGLGWDIPVGKRWSLDLGYSHTFFAKHSPLIQAANANNISATITHKNWLNISVGGDYAFGKTNDAFVTGAISKDITLGSITEKDVVSIAPSFSIVGGTQHFYSTYVSEKKIRDSIVGTVLTPIFGSPSNGSATTTKETTTFSLLSYNARIPLSYSRAHYMLEAAYQLSVMSNKAQLNPGNSNSFFTLSFYYQF